ncbi:hypothetical protein QYF36_009436 [Acer negundo]|nr:hypothetical protein QYF36_009436 [Acer negundo]
MQQVQIIHTISKGPTLVGTCNNSRKNHARKILRITANQDVFWVSKGSQEYPRSAQIIFTKEDVFNTVQPHDDPMVITLQIANCKVLRVQIDTRSNMDILFKRVHNKLKLRNPCYSSCTTPLYGFTRDSLMPVGSHRLLAIIEEAPLQQNIMTEFVVVDTPSAYNAILGRPFLIGIRGVLSVYHNVLKFPVGTKIDQLVDSTTRNKLFSFMDAFSEYYQIMMHPTDQDKTSFITRQGLYCYKVMPIGLKNAGATYQRLVNKFFKEHIGKSMEVYIDDMITKSQQTGQHLED